MASKSGNAMWSALAGAVTLAGVMLAVVTPARAVDLATGDAEAGEKSFRKCKICHEIGPNAKSKIGPMLTGIIGRPAGKIEGFAYSAAMGKLVASGLIWTPDKIDEFLVNPKAFLPDTKMTFAGLRDDQERANLIAYLAKFP